MTATAPIAALGADGRAAAAALRCAADVAVVVGPDGAVREARISPDLRGAVPATPSSPASEIVRPEDRQVFAAALAAASAGRIPDPVEVQHAGQPAGAIFRYAALPADRAGDVLLIGRLLQRTDTLSLRVSEAHLAVDRDEMARRATQTRYQMLFEGAPEAILVVALESRVVDEANPRALALLGLTEEQVVGQPVEMLVQRADRARIAGLVAAMAEQREVAPARLTLADSGRRVSLQGRGFRAFDRAQAMLRLDEIEPAQGLPPAEALVAELLRATGQAVALTDADGRIVWASEAFPSPAERSRGTLAELFEGVGMPLRSLLATAREHGRITCPGVQVRTADGHMRGDLTVVALSGDATPGFGLLFYADGQGAPEVPAERAIAEGQAISAALAQAPLKDLVRDVADAIERSCIEAALRLTDGNKAAAAEALGLSRQSLYLKLHRFGLL